MANFAAVILQCEKPLHHQSDALTSCFALSGNRVTVKIWSQYLQYLQIYLEIFICHLSAAMTLLEIDSISPVCRYIIEIYMPCFDELHLKKSRSACSVLGQNMFKYRYFIWAKWSTARRAVIKIGPLCTPHRALIGFIKCRAA